MKRNISKIVKQTLCIGIFSAMVSTSTFAAWWGTPGYEWAREKKLTSITNTATLNESVSLSNLYSTILKYLEYKEVEPKEGIVQNVGNSECYNRGLKEILNIIDNYVKAESLTADKYRIIATYIEHANQILKENESVLSRDDLKDVYLYLSLARYKAATLIDDYSYKTYILNSLGSVKYRDLIKYNIKPYYGEITRKEFLILMFSLLSDQNISEDEMINQFSEAGTLLGYNDDFMLSKKLTYAEMYTFLRRFEVFEFNPIVDEDGESIDDVIEIR